MDKKYNLPAVNKYGSSFIPKRFQMFPETSGKLFGNFFVAELVTIEIIGRLHLQKVQFYGCKQVLYFNKSRKVSLWKFPPEKNPPENISDNFVKFRKFFPTGDYFGKCHKISIVKSIIYRLYTSVAHFYPEVVSDVSGNFRKTFRKLFLSCRPVTNEITIMLHI